jgi:hypothetical protein
VRFNSTLVEADVGYLSGVGSASAAAVVVDRPRTREYFAVIIIVPLESLLGQHAEALLEPLSNHNATAGCACAGP